VKTILERDRRRERSIAYFAVAQLFDYVCSAASQTVVKALFVVSDGDYRLRLNTLRKQVSADTYISQCQSP
jgi:hypothetical protein